MYGAIAAAMFVAAAISIAVAFSAWDRRPLPGATGLSAFMAVTGIWALASGMGLMSQDHALEGFWYVLMFTAIVSTPPTAFALAYQYRHQTDAPPWWSNLLWVFPAVTVVAIITDPYHHLFTGTSGWNFHGATENGPWYWASIVYSYTVVVGAIGILVTANEKWGQRYRAQSIALLVSFVTPFATSVVSLATFVARYNIDVTPLATATSGLILAAAMFRWGLFRTVPIARELLVDVTSDGMVVIDPDGAIVDFNQAATQLLGSDNLCLGCAISDYIPEWDSERVQNGSEPYEFATRSFGQTKSIKVSATPVHQRGGGRAGGVLIVLRDISAEVAVIAMEQQARKRAELEASFTTTINRSLDYAGIVNELMITATRTTSADYALLFTCGLDGRPCELSANFGAEEGFDLDQLQSMAAGIRSVPMFDALLTRDEPILVHDALSEPQLSTPSHSLAHLRSVVGVRIDAWSDRIGILALGSRTPNSFNTSDVSRLTALANAAAGAIRNAEQLVTIERQAAQSEIESAKLRSVLDALLDPLAVLEPVYGEFGAVEDFTVVDVNELAREFQGIPRESILGGALSLLQPSTIRNGLLDRLVDAMRTGKPFVADDLDWSPSDGRPYFVDLRAMPYANGIIVNWRNVTDRTLAAQELRESEQRFRLLAENSLSAVFRMTDDGTVTWVSPSIYEALGWTPPQLAGRAFSEFVHPDDADALAAIGPDQDLTRSHVSRLRILDPGGLHHWVEVLSRAYTNARGEHEGMIASLRTVDEEVAIEQELERRARYDELTGVLNRRAVMERVVDIAQRGARTGQNAAIMFCDLDKLKDANERYGHAGGDRLIKTVASRMVTALRQTDTVGRFGGDEFLVLLEGIHDVDGAAQVAEKVRLAVAEPIQMLDGTSLEPGISIGVTIMGDNEDIDEVIDRANKGLFGAKREGRGRVVVMPSPVS